MSFSDAFNTITNSIKDLSQLNVRTYTGSIDANIDGDDAEAMLETAKATGNLKVVGITVMCIDGDTNQFITNDSEIKDSLLIAHQSAVQASQKSRQATVAMFTTAIQKVVGKLGG